MLPQIKEYTDIANKLINQTVYGRNGARDQIKLITHQVDAWNLLIDLGCVQHVDQLEEIITELQIAADLLKRTYRF